MTSLAWSPGERFHDVIEATARKHPHRLAVDALDRQLTYAQLVDSSARLARCLAGAGIAPGDRVGVLVAAPADAYAPLLAISRLGATSVSLDPMFPADRLAYLVTDAAVDIVITVSSLGAMLPAQIVTVCLDELPRVDPDQPLPDVEDPDPLAYVVYTSGSTGRPKGVMVRQSSLCNFIRVAADCYGIRGSDRMYQGLTIAFDFSVEEIWVPLAAGATLVPRPAGPNLLGPDLRDFLVDRQVTALCGVPTLLASVTDDAPSLRLLVVSGEACPDALAARWLRPGRRMLNVYGPTEATVSATWKVLTPDQPVTIGRALPSYAVYVVDPVSRQPLPPGETGEIAIAGPGVADGYLNRPDLTAAAFITLEPPGFPPVRGYLTGDLGRFDECGDLQYVGRVDAQVKLRGYRVELGEIESVMRQLPGIRAAVADVRPRGETADLVAYVVAAPGGYDDRRIQDALRRALPSYMVPTHLCWLEQLPVTAAGKIDRSRLPGPARWSRLIGDAAVVEPRTATERVVAAALAAALGVDRVSVTADFFDDLGADSMIMTALTARLRDVPGGAALSVRATYTHRNARALAEHLDGQPLAIAAPALTASPASVSRGRYAGFALAQAAVLLAGMAAAGAVVGATYDWTVSATSSLTELPRLVVSSLAILAAWCLAPVAVKWLVIGRQRDGGEIRLWSLAHFRFWVVRSTVRASPLARLTGTPLQLAYWRMLGARVGWDAVILTRHVPAVPDLVRIGRRSIIGREVYLGTYALDASGLRTGRVTIHDDCYVGAGSVLDIDVTMQRGSELAHSSSLLAGQTVPAAQCWHGSPGRPTDQSSRPLHDVPEHRPGAWLPALAAQLAMLVLLGLVAIVIETALGSWLEVADDTWARYSLVGLVVAVVASFGMLALRFAVAAGVPMVLRRYVQADRVYPRRGRPWVAARLLSLVGNARSLTALFGDSSYVVGYVRAIGYDIDGTEQTGSTFGLEFRQDAASLVRVGARTMASDGLSVLNLEVSSTSFRLRRTSIGRDCYLGNAVTIPAGATVADNCLLATKVMVPLGGAPRSGVGLLGSPAFEVPRTVARDTAFGALAAPARRGALLRAKNRHNLATMALHLFANVGAAVVALFVVGAVTGLASRPAPGRVALGVVALLPAEVGYAVIVERCAGRWRRLRPAFHSIYDLRFWRHERMWKLSATSYLALLDGTALKPWVWRMLGVRVGRRLLDDGASMPERSLVTIGDDCVLGSGSTIQCHSLEDATFKSDATAVGDGCVLGARSLVHYGVRLGERSTVRCDAFVMKGEQVPAGAIWAGNPAAPT